MITTPRVVIVCIVAALIGRGLVTAFIRPAKVVAAATPAAELPSAKGVRTRLRGSMVSPLVAAPPRSLMRGGSAI